MANFNQYFLLADHIKLSLLERQRAIYSNTNSASQDSYISRSLESLGEGIFKINAEQLRLKNIGDLDASQTVGEMGKNLQTQYDGFVRQFQDNTSEPTTSATSHMNNVVMSGQVTETPERSRIRLSTTSLKTSIRGLPDSSMTVKTVRFSDSSNPSDSSLLFPYRDEPDSIDNSHLDNQQLLNYHSKAMEQQDQALDNLSKSIQRQRELSIQIGGELDEQVGILDDIDQNVDRHTRIRNTMRQLETTAKNAKNNRQIRIIAVLLLILVALIIILNY